jgi:hypothetical protein
MSEELVFGGCLRTKTVPPFLHISLRAHHQRVQAGSPHPPIALPRELLWASHSVEFLLADWREGTKNLIPEDADYRAERVCRALAEPDRINDGALSCRLVLQRLQ